MLLSLPRLHGCQQPARVFAASAGVQAKAAATESPSQPKSISGYNLFMKQEYPLKRQEDSSFDFKKMSSLWKNLSDADKEKYNTQAKALPPAPAKAPRVPKQPKAATEPAAPKEPKVKRQSAPNAYSLYVKETLPQLKAKNPNAGFSDAGAAWKTLSASERQSWTDRAAELKSTWVPSTPQPAREKKETGPKKLSAYNAYVQANVATEKEAGTPQKEVFSKLAARWRGLSDTEKAKWKP